MSTRAVVIPCLPVARPHLREAFRALLGQGHPRDRLTDDVLARLLWLARALPVAVDVVADPLLEDTRFPDATVEVLRRPPENGPLCLVGWRRDDEPFVELLVLNPEAAAAGSFGDAFVRIVVEVETTASPPLDGDDETSTLPVVRLQRFSFG
ncbi:MAG: hypothetical protein FJ137_08280 [Deltaproteobacteria bacterium]|nr:hypothetical protein [Deltaproteobacteria bacterium]